MYINLYYYKVWRLNKINWNGKKYARKRNLKNRILKIKKHDDY